MVKDIVREALTGVKLGVATIGLILLLMYAFVVPDDRVLILGLLVIAVAVELEGIDDILNR